MSDEIVQAFKQLELADRDWLRAIENRPTGSSWGRFMPWQELAALPWEFLQEIERDSEYFKPECDYYHATSGLDPGAFENIKLLPEFHTFESIAIYNGPHGIELISVQIEPRPTSEAWLIIGPGRVNKSERVVWTAYPGKYAVSVTTHPLWDGTKDCLPAIAASGWPVAVKGFNSPTHTETMLWHTIQPEGGGMISKRTR